MIKPRNTPNRNLRSDAYIAAERRDASSLQTLCEFWRSGEATTQFGDNGYTILHFLAFYGNSDAIKKLRVENLLISEQLEMTNANGDTALHEAARFGRVNVVREILEGGESNLHDLVSLHNNSGETPIYVAAANGKKQVFDFLALDNVRGESVIETRRGRDGNTVLHAAVSGQFYRFALSILKSYPELAGIYNKKGVTALYVLACQGSSFISGTIYNIRNLSTSPFIPWRLVTIGMYYLSVPPTDVENPYGKTTLSHVRSGYTMILKAMAFFNEASEAREKHAYAYALAKKLVSAQKQWPLNKRFGEDSARDIYRSRSSDTISSNPQSHNKKEKFHDPLIEAIKNSTMELVKMILGKFPEAVNVLDESSKNIIQIAVMMKDTYMYEYLKKRVHNKEKMLSDVDGEGNTIFHLAADPGENSKNMHSPLLGMSWEVFWYYHVKKDIPLSLIHHENSKRLTARQIFRDSHGAQGDGKRNNESGGMMKEAEDDAKRVNEGLMLVSVLISTINFAAIFTIPGGFNQDSGIPIFFRNRDTKNGELDLFLLYVGVSLLASLIALGTQLSIHLSRFRKIDFYFVLPFKMFCATTALYYSTTFSITACFQAYILEEALKGKVLLVISAACVPAAFVYFDLVYYSMNYLYFPIVFNFLAPPRRILQRLISYIKNVHSRLFPLSY